MRPIVLSIAGSDPTAGAGAQADLKAIEANGGYAVTALTAVTVQNTRGVTAAKLVEPELLRGQIESLLGDLDVRAVKSGMLGSAALVRELARCLAETALPYVCDPLLFATSGWPLLGKEGQTSMVRELFPRATLVTPNVDEAKILTGLEIDNPDQAEAAGRKLLETGTDAVLIKGGHLSGSPGTDVLVRRGAASALCFHGRFIATPHTHGSGCIYAAAIATHLARGRNLERAVELAREFVVQAIDHGLALGNGAGPVDPLYRLHDATAGAVAQGEGERSP